ncbi:MAG TPA: hypothetical protein VLY03_13525 [Bacteroidota bacterium]|nr:hypothetical protein [Bacteroidota bacterium]
MKSLIVSLGGMLVVVVAASLSWSCKDKISGPDLGQIVFPSSGVSYSQQVQPLFNQGCGGQNNACHGPATLASAHYALDSYLDATADPSIIVRGAPDQSLLNLTVEGKTPPKMPPAGSPALTQNQITGLRVWVTEGAKGDN